MKKKTKFLLLGWDSADWKVINPLIDQGKMPALEKLINKGVMGNIATLDPPLSPMLWTSIATGKYAFKHGVHGFIEAAQEGQKISPVTQHSIKTSTVWDILNKNGLKTNVVGWWPSHPAKEINGVQVSNFYGKANDKTTWNNWQAAPKSIYPKSLEDKLNELRVHPGEFGINQIASFIEKLDLLEESDKKLINILMNDLAECVSIHSAATYIAENTEWDFMAVYYNAIDHLSHVFMKYHPPKLEWVDEKLYEKYNQVINAMYQFHDMMLERWLKIVDEDCYVMVLSDHGFHSDDKRVQTLPNEPAAIAREHNQLGMVALKGPGIKQDEIIYGSSLLDVCPTILSIFNLPIGSDMDGKVLYQMYDEPKEIKAISTWDNDSQIHAVSLNKTESNEMIQQLVDLGYLENSDFNSPDEIKRILDENNFYLARSYYDAQKYKEASLILKKLCTDYPKNSRYAIKLAECYVELQNTDALQNSIISLEDLLGKNKPYILLLKGKLAMLLRQYNEALSYFNQLSANQNKQPLIEYYLGNCYLKLKKYKEAVKHFKNNLKFNKENAYALQGLGMCYLALNKIDQAIDCFIDSISIRYFNPSTHFFLGKAFLKIENYTAAEQAFAVALQQEPRMSKARAALIELYKNDIPNQQKILELEQEIQQHLVGEIIIVSGLPRSGTSLMMQMLNDAGLEIFTDNKRKPDINNPKGYFEHEAIKILHINNKIIKEANGKVVKIISPLISYLPLRYNYKVIFMKRHLNQVANSQDAMLEVLKNKPKDTTLFDLNEKLQKLYTNAKDYVNRNKNFTFIEVDYENLINNPDNEIKNIIQFLQIDPKKKTDMKKNIDISLHRNK
ncbi:MAG: alkaline phosphatase family protein [Chitinophagales bacterium]|nr:alkaline phosphatase family protein [Chitinophagales bacterium]